MIDVSVVIPTYNRIEYLKNAIRSCLAGNENIEVEVVVVDDGSTDGTRSYLQSLNDSRIKPVLQSSQGAQVARNTGKDVAAGRYIKFLDDDDWLKKGSLQKEVKLLNETAADFLYGNFQIRREKDAWTYKQKVYGDVIASIFKESVWTPPFGFLYKSEVVREVEWEESLPYHQDYAFALSAVSAAATSVYLNAVVGIIREHHGVRINDLKSSTPKPKYYKTKVDLIKSGLGKLQSEGRIQSHHRKAAAEGIWNWAHIVAGYDLDTFRQFYDDIEAIAPDFHPKRNRSWLAVLDNVVGPKGTEHVLYPARRMKHLLK
jgi:glycosyltransferase involved in cell wall biosynthesis